MTHAQRHNGAQPSGLRRIPAEDSVPDSYAKHPARRGAWRRVRTDVRLHCIWSKVKLSKPYTRGTTPHDLAINRMLLPASTTAPAGGITLYSIVVDPMERQ